DVAADLVVAQFLPEGVKFELDLDAAATDLDGLYQALIIAWEQESQDLLALFDRRATLFASHESWSSFTEPTLLQAYRKQVAVELYRHHGPGLLQEIPEAMTTALQPLLQSEVTPVDWRKALHFFSNSARRTQWAATIKRPSKRYGTTPGYRVRNKARLLVALDTSASISEADLSRFFKELQVLWRQGLELEVVECDQAIRRHYRYRGQLPDRVQGRGGTAFYPIFNYVAERQHFDGIIYFTDGKGVHPGKVPKIPLLWVLSPSGIAAQRLEEQQFPGRFIQMNN
ncbi:MAG: hypothetical protein KDC44_13380, partial [Phaeodactylibacter sp.]|nr:hypothetical protein [Phaeodactylibacter sp.]